MSATRLIALPRSCSWEPGQGQPRESRPIEDFRDRRCYVLLGDPGAGKSSVFAQEAEAGGVLGPGVKVTARDFINLPLLPAWKNKVLFIDGLDEMRAGGSDGRTPLDQIRNRLAELDTPPFRLSCRAADWLGTSDQGALLALYSADPLPVLYLDELDEADSLALLEHYQVPSPPEFLAQARHKGLHDFLRTPLNIGLLVKAVGSGQLWPETRQRTYERAVTTLVNESNIEHQAAQRNLPLSTADLMTTAGELSTILLLAQLEGYALDASAEDATHPAFGNLDLEKPSTLAALRTKLFISNGAESLRKPFHRTIAEYLAAKYLAQRIEGNKHSITRVLALLSLADGTIVPSLRGLAAWLAVFSLPCRAELIERDPAGMLVYGDAASLSDADLAHILRAYERLARHSPTQRFNHWDETMIAALARPTLAPVIAEYLATPLPDETIQAVLRLILKAFDHAVPAPELLPQLEALARNEALWPTLRCDAVNAWVRHLNAPAAALAFLSDLHDHAVADEDDHVLGTLLGHLFPHALSAEKLRSYLHLPAHPYRSDNYTFFWEYVFFERATPDDLHQLLDALAANPLPFSQDSGNYHIRRFLGELVAKGLESLATPIPLERLTSWLSIGRDEFSSLLEEEDQTRIRAWLTAHPDIYKALLLHLIHGCETTDRFRMEAVTRSRLLYDAPPPAGFDLWCLEIAAQEPSSVIAEYFFSEAFSFAFAQGGRWQGDRLEDFERWVEAYPRFQAQWQQLVHWEIPEYRRESAQRKKERETTRRNNREAWIERIRSHLAALQSNTAPPGLLHDLAAVYDGHFSDVRGTSPLGRLHALLGDDNALISAITLALHNAIERTDVPTVAQIIDTDLKGKHFYLRPACLIALDRRQAQGAQQVLALSDEQLGKALAFRFTFDVDKNPEWVKLLLREKPALYVDVYQAYASANLKAGRQHIAGLYALVHDPDYKNLATSIGPQLLTCIPLRLKKDRLNHLRHLLAAGLRHFPAKLMVITEARLGLKGLDAPQRVLWTTCAALLRPDQYGDVLSRHVGGQETRAAVLAEFLDSRHGAPSVPSTLPATMLDRLIRILGPLYPPLHPEGAHWVSPAERAADGVETFINQLSLCPGKEAEHLLQSLLTAKPLVAWISRLEFALDKQRNATREASFRPPSATQVVASLKQGRPASPGELKALVLDLLHRVGKQLRHGDTNGYRRFWEGDKPDIENNCRDHLLDLIRPHLEPLGIEAQKEGYFAEDKRADICISSESGKWIVPVEIKRDCHPEIWRAIKKQLMGQYTPDPRAYGQGIYLALWFGGKGTPLPPSGARPATAEEMERRLRDTLSPAEQRMIGIVVLDVSQPTAGDSSKK